MPTTLESDDASSPRPRGRPRKNPLARKSERWMVNMTPGLAEKVDAALPSAMHRSEWLRRLVAWAVASGWKPAP